MSFTSYAQNFEDVMLWRALKHVENGFYIDIGAQDPMVDSVSLAFYEHGWRGVHVEPTTQYANQLKAARPDETVMQVAIGSIPGPLTFFEFKDTGLSTADPTIAQQHKANGFACVETHTPVISLDELLGQHGTRPVHWLKLDVEGLEKSVLESWQSSAVRPWILVIESTLPLTQAPSHADWEPLVLAKGYDFVYFDGLNRFYVSQAQPDLKKALTTPPNVFDDFVLSGRASQPFYKFVEKQGQRALQAQKLQTEQQLLDAENRVLQADAHSQELETELIQTREELQAVHHSNHQHWLQAEAQQQQIQAIYASTSWQVTRPVRWLGLQIKRLRAEGLAARIRALSKKVGRKVVHQGTTFLSQKPGLRSGIVTLLRCTGQLDRVKHLYARVSGQQRTAATSMRPRQHTDFTGNQAMTPRSLAIFADLKNAYDKTNGGSDSCA